MDSIFEKFRKIPTYYIEIGVFSEDGERQKDADKKTKDVIRLGVNNAELMYIHENGSPINRIPARPVLQMAITQAKKEWLENAIMRAINAYVRSGFNLKEYEKELERLCMKMEKYARDIIYLNDGRLAPNAPSVAKRKKGNHPLFDTGQLARSISCRLIKS